jgi:hypothetical protein
MSLCSLWSSSIVPLCSLWSSSICHFVSSEAPALCHYVRSEAPAAELTLKYGKKTARDNTVGRP